MRGVPGKRRETYPSMGMDFSEESGYKVEIQI